VGGVAPEGRDGEILPTATGFLADLRSLIQAERRDNRQGWRLPGKPLKRSRFPGLEVGWNAAETWLAIFGFGRVRRGSHAAPHGLALAERAKGDP
jgi:hypothetical protein